MMPPPIKNMTKAPCNPWTRPKPATLSPQIAALYSLPKEVLAGRGIAPQRPAQALRPGEWITDLPLNRNFVDAVLKEMGTPAASPGQIQMLEDINGRYEKLEERLVEWSATAVSNKWKDSRDTIADQPDTTRLESREAMQHEARARRLGLHAQLGALSGQAYDIILAISTDVQKTIAKFAARREKIERDEAENFGIEFQPSAILVTAWQASWRLVAQLSDPVLQNPPRFLLKNLPIFLIKDK
jgi:hypothetical protein